MVNLLLELGLALVSSVVRGFAGLSSSSFLLRALRHSERQQETARERRSKMAEGRMSVMTAREAAKYLRGACSPSLED